ncbi:MAG: signal peptidase I [Acetanaerobacterium sp.]
MQQEAELFIDEQQSSPPTPPPKADPARSAYEWAETLVWCFLFVVVLFTFAFRVVGVFGHSMENTLFQDERLVTVNYITPTYGDIVAITRPTNLAEPLIKRVIATEGQTVDIDFDLGEVYVDGELLTEEYIKTPTTVSGDVKFPQTVPKGSVFVMGDNRDRSLDGRFQEIGMVDVRYIFGKAVFRLYPFNRIGSLHL